MSSSAHSPLLLGLSCLVVMSLWACHDKKSSRDLSVNRLLAEAKEAMGRGDTDRAVQVCRKAVKAQPMSAKAWNRLGLALEYRFYETGDEAYRDEALSSYGKAIKLDHDCGPCLVNKANMLWSTGRMKEAGALYRKALTAWPRHPDASAIKQRIATAQAAESDGLEQKGEKQ